MINKLGFLFLVAIGMLLIGLATYLDTGLAIGEEQPGLDALILIGFVSNFAGGLLIARQHNWLRMSSVGCIAAILTGIAINPNQHPPLGQTWLWIFPLGTYIGLAVYLFRPSHQQKSGPKLIA